MFKFIYTYTYTSKYNGTLNPRRLHTRSQAVLSSGSAERVLDSTTARRKLATNILEHTAANGTEAACGPTVTGLMSLCHLGYMGRQLLLCTVVRVL